MFTIDSFFFIGFQFIICFWFELLSKYCQFSLSKLLSHYDDWLFLDLYSYDYFSYNEVSPIVKIPESNHFNISFATDPTFNFYTFYNIVYFNDKLNDSGVGHNIYFNYSFLFIYIHIYIYTYTYTQGFKGSLRVALNSWSMRRYRPVSYTHLTLPTKRIV